MHWGEPIIARESLAGSTYSCLLTLECSLEISPHHKSNLHLHAPLVVTLPVSSRPSLPWSTKQVCCFRNVHACRLPLHLCVLVASDQFIKILGAVRCIAETSELLEII